MKLPRILDADHLPAFLCERPFSVIHLDADWDVYRHKLRAEMEKVAEQTGGDTSFGYLDIDQNRDHARSIGLLNVPASSNYRGRELVATVIGMNQDIAAILAKVKAGLPPDTSNKISRL